MTANRQRTDDERNRGLIVERLRDYAKADIHTLHRSLIEQWRAVHPEAAREASSALKPLIRHDDFVKTEAHEPDEAWFNDTYYVTVRRNVPDKCFGTAKGMIQLGIASHDGTARHDWRDFQAIKNQLAGEECEAFELYPAESRLLDPSNYYTLWCFPFLKRLHVGGPERRVHNAAQALAPQRAFPDEV